MSVISQPGYDFALAFKKQSGTTDVTLGLSFWTTFRDEIASTCSSTKDYDDSPYLVFEDSPRDRVLPWPVVLHTLSITRDCIEFSAALDPLSQMVVWSIHVISLPRLLSVDRLKVASGTVSVLQRRGEYHTVAHPPIEQLSLADYVCDYDTFWEVPKSLGRWACANVILRDLRQASIAKAVAADSSS